MRLPGRDADELCVERSGHHGTEFFDSFSESCNGASRDPSRRGANEPSVHGPSPQALAARVHHHFPFGRGRLSDLRCTKSLSSGAEYYKLQRQQQQPHQSQQQQQQQHTTNQTSPLNQSSESSASRSDAVAVKFSFLNIRGGETFEPRWAHGAAAIGDRIYVYGGVAATNRPLAGLFIFNCATNQWRPATPHMAKGAMMPPPMWGHAMAAADNKIWLWGGRVKGLRRGKIQLQNQSFCLDIETLTWSALPRDKHSHPPAVSEGTLTNCGGHGIIAFGGYTGKQGATASVHVLNPATAAWSQILCSGVPPDPRAHHTAVWDGCNRLIIFGGTAADSTSACDSAVHVLHLILRQWTRPPLEGGTSAGPCARSQHCASLLGWECRTMAVIGGRGSQGELLNDVWLLEIGETWRWRPGRSQSARPSGHCGASCALVGAHIALCGGLSGNGPMDSVLLLSTNARSEEARKPFVRSGRLMSDREQSSSGAKWPPGTTSSGQTPSDRSATCASSLSSLRQTLPALTDDGQTSCQASEAQSDSSQRTASHHARQALAEPTQKLEAAQKLEEANTLLSQERAHTAALRSRVSELLTLAKDRQAAMMDEVAALKEEAAVDARVAAADAEKAAHHIQDLKAQMKSAAAAADEKLQKAFAASIARQNATRKAAAASRGQAASLARRCSDLSRRLNLLRRGGVAASYTPSPLSPLQRLASYPLGRHHLAYIEEERADQDEVLQSAHSCHVLDSLSDLCTRALEQTVTTTGQLPAVQAPRAVDDSSCVRTSPPTSPPSAEPRRDGSLQGVSAPKDGSPRTVGGPAAGEAAAAAAVKGRPPSDPQTPAAVDEVLHIAFSQWCGFPRTNCDQSPPCSSSTPTSGAPLACHPNVLEHASSVPNIQSGSQPDSQHQVYSLGFADVVGSEHHSSSGSSSDGAARGSRVRQSDSLELLKESLYGPTPVTMYSNRGGTSRSPSAVTEAATADRVRRLELQAAFLSATPTALAACTAGQLQDLHRQLSTACATVGQAIMQRRQQDGKEDEAEGHLPSCPLCCDLPLQVVFNCGHQVCEDCSLLKCPIQCPVCFEIIEARIPLASF